MSKSGFPADVAYWEAGWRDYGDAQRVARPNGHSNRLTHMLAKGGIVDVPEIRWTWSSTEHLPGDMICSTDGLRVVSPLVRQILDEHRTVKDDVQWLPGAIELATGETLPYWVPHFPVHHDFLDRENSTFGPSGIPIRYSLSAEKLSEHAVTIMPGDIVGPIILARAVVESLAEAGTTGFRVSPVTLS